MVDESDRSPSGRRGLSRRWRRSGGVAATALAVYAIVGFFVLPWIARSQIEKQSRALLHREARVERVRFNPFTLAASVEGLELKDLDGSALLKLERFAANLQLSGIFRRAWTFREVVLDRPHVVVRILPDGKLSIADLLEPKPPAPGETADEGLPRVLVHWLVISGGRLDFVDESKTPRFSEALAPLNLGIHDLSTLPDRSGDHAVTVGIGERAIIRWSGRQTVEPPRLTGRFEVTGISLARVWSYAAAGQPLVLHDGFADVSWSYDLRVEGDALSLALDDAAATVRDVKVRPLEGGEDWLALPLVEAKAIRAAWPESRLEVGSVRIDAPHVLARREVDGRTSWQSALARWLPAPGAAAESGGKPWTVLVGTIDVTGGSGRFEDLAVEPDVPVEISAAALTLTGVSSDLAAPVAVRASLRVNGSAEAAASGSVVPDPLAADLEVSLSGLDVVPFHPYAKRIPGAEIRGGRAGAKGRLRVAPGSPSINFEGDASLDGLEIHGAGADRLIACDEARASGIRLTQAPDRLRIKHLGLDRAFLKLHIDREGKINLARLAQADPGTPAAPAPSSTSKPISVDITAIVLRDAKVDFTDESLILPFGTEIHSANGSIQDLSTTSAAAARLELEGRVAATGFVKSGGALRVSDPLASTDVDVTFRDVQMPDLTPYVAQFAGYSVKSGVLDLDLHYRIQDRRLVGDHKVVIADMVLGPKVEGADAPGLPIRLAIALLKDKDGRIDLEVPVEGTIDSPDFNYRKIFWQAFKKILGNVVKAPFRAIGRAFGRDDEDLDLVGFASGRSDLIAPEQETLTKLASELAGRPEISIEVGGRFDPIADVQALRQETLDRRIDARRTDDATLEAILESLYAETFTPERLAERRAGFQPGASTAPPPPSGKRNRGESPPPPAKDVFDAAGFYDALRADLLEAEPVDEQELRALATARAAAVVAALTAPGGMDASRVSASDPAPVQRKKRGSDLVASEMTMTAKD